MPRNAPADTAVLRATQHYPQRCHSKQAKLHSKRITHFSKQEHLLIFPWLLLTPPPAVSAYEAAACASGAFPYVVLLKQRALLAFGLFYISRVAQTGLSRARDMSHHLKLHLWVVFWPVCQGRWQHLYTLILICIEYKALRVRLCISCLVKSMLLQLFFLPPVF